MKYFKTVPTHEAESFQITIQNFADCTGYDSPFVQRAKDSDKVSFYAYCPSCLNSIQIIGLSEIAKVRPYGRHTGKTVEGFRTWNYDKYVYCPYADRTHRISPSDDWESNTIIDEKAVGLYNLLRDQFDRVVYVISKELGIRGNKDFWRGNLKCFLNGRTYTFPWLTDTNLPYVFAFWGMQQQNLWGLLFQKESLLYNALLNHPDISFCKPDEHGYCKYKRVGRRFVNLQFRFFDFRQNAVEGEELRKSFRIGINDRGMENPHFFECRIDFNENFLQNLIYHGHEENRQQWLLDIAAELMPDIQPNV